MQPIENEGRTVAEAVEAALKTSGLRRDQVEITVLDEGAQGFLGLGAKPARVRLTEKRWGPDSPAPSPAPAKPVSAPRPARPPRPAPPPPRPFIPAPTYVAPKPAPAPAPAPAPRREQAPRPAAPRREARPQRERSSERAPAVPLTPAETTEACAKAQTLVIELLQLMTIAAPTATVAWDAALERVKVSVESQDATALVGRDGRVLESLQFLATLMLSRGAAAPIAVQVDALSYWEKRETAILDGARSAIESVKATGKPVRLEPMDSSMRRLIHRTFAASTDVTTSSEGEGTWRKIVVRPRKG